MIDESTKDRIPPRASTLIERMRDIGYSWQTAAADTKTIDVVAELDADVPLVAFIDDGGGMNLEELREAMRPGTKGPLAERSSHDLGRFGLGLKTASFSQCRRLTVASRRRHGGQLVARTWNLDHVAETNDWLLQIPDLNGDRPANIGQGDTLPELVESIRNRLGLSDQPVSHNFEQRLLATGYENLPACDIASPLHLRSLRRKPEPNAESSCSLIFLPSIPRTTPHDN